MCWRGPEAGVARLLRLEDVLEAVGARPGPGVEEVLEARGAGHVAAPAGGQLGTAHPHPGGFLALRTFMTEQLT